MFARFRFDAKRPFTPGEEETDASGAGEQGGDRVAQEEEEEEDGSPSQRRKRIKVENAVEPQAEPSLMATTAITEQHAADSHKWQERWHSICSPCFDARIHCVHFPEERLRLMIIGHNPSDHAWASGFSYSNPSNRFWNLLRGSLPPMSWRGILPADAHIGEQNNLPYVYGVGLTSIGLEPGNDAASYGKDTMARWRADFFQRLRRHVRQVCQNDHGCSDADTGSCTETHAPMLIAFSGKRQFSYLFSPPLAKVDHFGVQTRLPSGWPRECLPGCEVWVLPSSSGRAAMTTAERAVPYQQLADRFHQLPWPLAANPSVKNEIVE